MASFKVKQIEDTIRAKDGNVTEVAKALGVSRTAIYKRINNSERLQIALEEARQSLVDLAETKLRQLINEGNPAAVFFTLKTIGQDRGYIEQRHVDLTTGGQPIKGYVGISPDDWDDETET